MFAIYSVLYFFLRWKQWISIARFTQCPTCQSHFPAIFSSYETLMIEFCDRFVSLKWVTRRVKQLEQEKCTLPEFILRFRFSCKVHVFVQRLVDLFLYFRSFFAIALYVFNLTDGLCLLLSLLTLFKTKSDKTGLHTVRNLLCQNYLPITLVNFHNRRNGSHCRDDALPILLLKTDKFIHIAPLPSLYVSCILKDKCIY